MASPKTRGRMIRKNISDSVGFSKLSPSAAVLFCMLIPHFNPHGKMNGGFGYIKDEVCPRIPYLTIDNLPELLHEISLHTNVKWFERDGRWWLHSLNFLKEHQVLRADRLGEDLLPDFVGTIPGLCPPEVEVEVEVEVEDIRGEPTANAPPETDEVYIAKVKKFYNELEEENGPAYSDWQKHYSDTINVDACLFAATTWLVENPRNRKKNLKRFYGNWLRNQYTRRTQPRT